MSVPARWLGAALLVLGAALPARAQAAAAAQRVRAGESIQAAIEAARPGAIIEVEPGTYHEALTVDTPGITLRGIIAGGERPVLDGGGTLNDGVIASGSPFTMRGFRIEHYKGNGVSAQGVDGPVLDDLVIDDTGLYGVYPVQSRNVTVTHCTVTRISDAAIYVGQSKRALVAYNEVHRNVAGIEIENTDDAVVRDNLVYENTAGILAFVLPGKVQKEGLRNAIFRNWVLNNNAANFGDPHAIVGRLPFGLGVMVMGADDTEVHDNWIKGNQSLGIAVVRLAADQARKDPPLEPLPDQTRIGANFVSGNGLAPHPDVQRDFGGGGDVGWDGTGSDNCASLPESATHAGAILPACMERDDAGRHAAGAGAPGEGPSTMRAAPSGGAARAAPVLPAGSTVVHIRSMRFEPYHVTVARGSTVVWVNDDAIAHTVTSGAGTRPTHAPLDSPFLMHDDVYAHTFDAVGVYEYLCLPHMDQAPMRGATVRVRD